MSGKKKNIRKMYHTTEVKLGEFERKKQYGITYILV